MSFKGVSSALSERLSKTLSETGLNLIEPQHFCGVCTQSVWLVVEGSLVEISDKESQVLLILGYRVNDNMACDSVEAGWDHHFAHSSMQGMTINHMIFA